MEAIKIKGIAKNGELTVLVPNSFNEKELEVIVLSTNASSHNSDVTVQNQRIEKLMSIVGTAKHSNLSNDILNVYEQ